MNIYLYPWHTDLECKIEKIAARNYNDCETRIIAKYCNRYDDLDDTLEFEDFISELGDMYGIYIGTIYEIDEFM